MSIDTIVRSAVVATAVAVSATTALAQAGPTADEIKSISEEAIIYGLPMSMYYKIMNQYAIDKDSGQYKAPFNQIANEPKVYTPADTAIVTPNSDTPYSFLFLDLRAEPVVLCVPEIEKDRYYSVMLTSQYTFNFGYIGSRATGNGAGCYAVAGPAWAGDTPKGIKKVFTSGTDFALATYRTQLFNAADIDKVKAIQAKYEVKPLSAFLGEPAPAGAPAIDWPAIDASTEKKDVLSYLPFLLQFAPPTGSAAVEIPLREKFASIGIESGKTFPTIELSDADKTAMAEAGKAAEEAIKAKIEKMGKLVNGWIFVNSGIGDRDVYAGDWTQRAAVAVAGILANDSAEAVYPLTRNDADSQPLDGSKSNYTLTFPKDAFPPVNAFWSVTMYDGKTQLLIKNPIDRYLVNSPMLPDLKKNADGSLTLYIQKDEPTDPDQKANWLPAPDGPIYMVMRLYWPKEAALNGSWSPPGIVKAE
ncbi:MAG TPA: DUF1254 domain-containing protein [Kiloniellaceae bacterium]|nr:DUF1254 domain-containing protein [Kiloniellaceae bacterium]